MATTIPIVISTFVMPAKSTLPGPIIWSIPLPTRIGTYNVEATVTAAMRIDITRNPLYFFILFNTLPSVDFCASLLSLLSFITNLHSDL